MRLVGMQDERVAVLQRELLTAKLRAARGPAAGVPGGMESIIL